MVGEITNLRLHPNAIGGPIPELTPEQIDLAHFFDSLWGLARQEIIPGQLCTVLRRDPYISELPPIQVPLDKIIDTNLGIWQDLTKKAFVTNPRKKIGLPPKDAQLNISAESSFTPPTEDLLPGESPVIPIKHSRMTAVFDNDPPGPPYFFPPDPLKGIPQIKVDVFELFKDSEKRIRQIYARTLDRDADVAATLKRRVAETIHGQARRTDDVLNYEDLTFYEVTFTGRTTFYDEEKARLGGQLIYQPINALGFKFSVGLTDVRAYYLAAWEAHDAWRELPFHNAELISLALFKVEKTLNHKFALLSNALRPNTLAR